MELWVVNGIILRTKKLVKMQHYGLPTRLLDITKNALVGVCYFEGTYVEKDYGAAIAWFEKAADKGDAAAQYYLGKCCAQGLGMEKNVEKARAWYAKSAAQGYEPAAKAEAEL